MTLVFLEANGTQPVFKKEDLEALVIEVGRGQATKEQIATFFRTGSLISI